MQRVSMDDINLFTYIHALSNYISRTPDRTSLQGHSIAYRPNRWKGQLRDAFRAFAIQII